MKKRTKLLSAVTAGTMALGVIALALRSGVQKFLQTAQYLQTESGM